MSSLQYKKAGVDIDAGERLVDRIKPLSSSIGGFAGLHGIPLDCNNPILVSSADGVGTKLLIALETKKYHNIGIDLVAMCINDIICSGADPLFFLDYIACGKLSVDVAEQLIKGMYDGCKQASCTLLGGETAEMPGMYESNKYDLAGFAVGVVDKEKIIGGYTVQDGDIVLGIKSSGLHSNGFSLVRTILEKVFGNDYIDKAPESLIDMIMEPTKIYYDSIKDIFGNPDVHGISHITGGGIVGNAARSIPKMKKVVLESSCFPNPSVIEWIKLNGELSDEEMYNVFNCGIGMTVVVNKNSVEKLSSSIKDDVLIIGEVKNRIDQEPRVEIV